MHVDTAPGGTLDKAQLLAALTALKKGDFSVRLPGEWVGLEGKIADTFNDVTELNQRMAAELARLSQVVGKEGKISQRASIGDVGGSWAEAVGSVNALIGDLVHPTSETARVIGAVAKGDLTQAMALDIADRPLQGEFLRTALTVNRMVTQLNSFASEVTRVAREVGTEGKLGGQAQVGGVAGTWKDLTDNVNLMAGNLTGQVRNIAEVATAIANGDLSKKITVDVQGEILGLKITVNTMVDQLNSFGSEVTRVAREVGTEGKLGGQAQVRGVAGIWKDLTDNVNFMAGNLTGQVRNIAEVATAIANGDLSKKITVDVQGEILGLKNTINTMVDQLNSFASEVTRVAGEVGTEGKLGGQARVPGVSGTWKDLTDNVNLMAGNLTGQVRNIAEVTKAVASGDLSKKITVDVQGEILGLKNTINTMVDQLNSFASEVTRVAREVGTEGKLGGQAQVPGVAGTWKDLTDNVNFMAGNLTSQVRNIAAVTTAVANGDLSKKITVDVKGEILELKDTINTMVDQLSSFASEVTRVAREVGTEGKLGGQAAVEGVAGTWKDLTDNVNFMAGNLTSQVRNIAEVTKAVASGDLSKKITVDVKGEILELKATINTMVDQLRSFASEVTRVAREVGTEGRLGGQADVQGVAGTWKDLTDNVNFMAGNLTSQVRNIAEVTKAVASGDLSKKITVDVKGEILELKATINTMVDQLNSFASEVTRVAREVGTEGKLGGQADVKDVAGIWKDLTDSVNFMAGNLTSQVRGIAKVVTAVANGDLQRRLTVEAKGEIAELADTINGMTDTLAIFADQVTSVAREVGVEGKLGGQASVPGAAGTWRDLTDNVNQLAANLTTQVRAIADVATAVTKGDLTRSISVAAQGEVASLKDNINEMIRNLKDTTIKNNEQDWLKTNLAKFSRMLQGEKDLLTVGKLILSELAPVVTAQQAVFYTVGGEAEAMLRLLASYAHSGQSRETFQFGEGLVGQCAVERRPIHLRNVPSDYIKISSGLGEAAPHNVLVLPVLFEGELKGVLELASFERFSPTHEVFLQQLMESIGIVLHTIEANMRTEQLLVQSQSLAQELRSQQQELQKTNQELKEKAQLLADQNVEVERKSEEVEHARQALEEKAEQLALTSKYKSEFLANMSHELRTPLNSLLILSDQLQRNQNGNLTPKQVEFSTTINEAGKDLLALINDILDLSKIESGTVSVEAGDLALHELREYVERTFRHVADARGLSFSVKLEAGVPAVIETDSMRLQQVLKNLLSNAFKFTEHGKVEVRIRLATRGWSTENVSLATARSVLAFEVTDTGIGIPLAKQQIIFEAFQQADASTSRRYGGTGLGLALSREISRLLGGEIRIESTPDVGSAFTLYLPSSFRSTNVARRLPPNVLESSSGHRRAPIAALPPPETTLARDVVEDDRRDVQPGDRTLLIVDNDVGFSRYMLDLAHAHGFKGLVTAQGSVAVSLARQFHPDAVTLDIRLPDIDGWRVLHHLKSELSTRHLPVVLISTDDEASRGFHHGAFDVLQKPVSTEDLDALLERISEFVARSSRRLLVVEDNSVHRDAVVEMLRGGDVEVRAVSTGEAALEAIQQESVDCLVVDLGLPDMNGMQFIEAVQRQPKLRHVPIIVNTARSLSSAEDTRLRRVVRSVVQKGEGSMERLLDETSMYLHRAHDRIRPEQRALLESRHLPNVVLAGKTILVVDDDVRNIFAMTTILEEREIVVLRADNGRTAIDILESSPGIDGVLMDIMMPGMDGYETMRAIRAIPRFRSLPIIALTAKAMKGDREKCIESGASDYIAKPVDTEQVLALLGIWLWR